MVSITKPVIVVNFKAYEQAIGEKALALAKNCEEVSKDIIACVNAVDLAQISKEVECPVFAQHVDGRDFGSQTGKILPTMIKNAKAQGTLINHSEDRYKWEDLVKAVEKCKEDDLFAIVCTKDVEESKKVAALGVDAIAVEPPELIGGDISVTTANPAIVSDTVEAVHAINPDIPVLCGAGVKTQEDVRKSIELGAMGVLLASGVTKAADPKAVLEDLNKGL